MDAILCTLLISDNRQRLPAVANIATAAAAALQIELSVSTDTRYEDKDRHLSSKYVVTVQEESVSFPLRKCDMSLQQHESEPPKGKATRC